MRISILFSLLLVLTTRQFKLKAAPFARFKSIRSFNHFKPKAVLLDDPDRFTLTKRLLARGKYALSLSYSFETKLILLADFANGPSAWAFVDPLNPFTVFSATVDWGSDDCLQLKQLVKTTPDSPVEGLESILAVLNRVDWTRDALESLNARMSFQWFFAPQTDSANDSKQLANLLLKNSGLVTKKRPSPWEYQFNPVLKSSTITSLSTKLQFFFTKIVTQIQEVLSIDDQLSMVSADDVTGYLSQVRQTDPAKANLFSALIEISNLVHGHIGQLTATFADKQAYEDNFRLSDLTRDRYNAEVLPLFHGNMIFVFQVLAKQLKEAHPLDGGVSFMRSLLETERAVWTMEATRRDVFLRLFQNQIAQFVADRIRRWEPRGVRESAFCRAFKELNRAILGKLLDSIDGFGLGEQERLRLERFLRVYFESIKKRFFDLSPGAVSFLLNFQIETNLALKNVYDSAISAKLGISVDGVSLTRQMAYLLSLLGVRSALYPGLPESKHFAFVPSAKRRQSKYLV